MLYYFIFLGINISKLPAIKFILLIIPGIVLGYYLNSAFIIISVSLISIILSIFMILKKNFFIPYILITSTAGLIIGFKISSISLIKPNKIIPEIPAIFEGKVIKVLKSTELYTRCVCQGWLDAKPLPKIDDTRLLLTILQKENKIKIRNGDIIYSNVFIKSPKSKSLITDFPESQYCASFNAKWLGRTNSLNTSILVRASNLITIIENISFNISSKIELLFSKSSSPIVAALLLGDKSKLSSETRQIFTLSGTAHIIAVSGLHVGIIAGFIYLFMGFFSNRWLKFILFSTSVILFVLISGLQPSALRAGVMAMALVFMQTVERRIELLNILGFAVLIVLIFSPELVFSIGFQLSVVSVLSIAILLKPIRSFLRNIVNSENKILQYLINSLSVTIAASLIVSPLVAWYFETYSIISPIANLIVIPIMSFAIVFSVLAVSFSYILDSLGGIYAAASDFLIKISYSINDFFVRIPLAYIEGSISLIVSVFVSVSLIYIFLSPTLKIAQFRFIISSVIVSLSLFVFNDKNLNNNIEIIPREQFVAMKIPLRDSSTFFILSDRNSKQYPLRDVGMEKYILNTDGKIKLGVTGASSLKLYESIKDSHNIQYFELNYPLQVRIGKLLGVNEKIPQIISLSYEYRNN